MLAGLLATGVTGSLLAGAVGGVAAASVPMAMARRNTRIARRRLREAWPDAIATLISAVRSGVSLPEACMGIADRGPAVLLPAFASFRASYRASGSFQTALERLTDELDDPVADRVGWSWRWLIKSAEPSLCAFCRALGDFVRDDLRTRKEIEARWSWAVTAARVAAAAPWIVLLLMSTRPEAAKAYNSASGSLVIAAGAVTTILGYRLMLRAARLPEERRLGR